MHSMIGIVLGTLLRKQGMHGFLFRSFILTIASVIVLRSMNLVLRVLKAKNLLQCKLFLSPKMANVALKLTFWITS